MLKKIKFFNSDTGQWEIVAVAEKGEQGPQGDPFTYDDFTEEQLEGLRGPQGEQGIQGERGYHFTPSVDIEGNISWTNNGELENPPMINIRGPQGDKGDKGDNGVFSKTISAIEIVPELPGDEWEDGTLYIVVRGEGGE